MTRSPTCRTAPPSASASNATVELADGRRTRASRLLCMDLDRFKAVNDVFGHVTGDALLREVAARMQEACQGAFLARLGGDEFAVITPTGPQPAHAEALAERLAAVLDADIEIDGQRAAQSASPSASPSIPQDGADASTLVVERRRRALPRQGGGARLDPLLRSWRWTSSCASGARCSRTCARRSSATSSTLHYQPQAHDRRRDHRLRGAGALAASGARHGAAERLHPAGRGERPDHRARRMDHARGLPRGGILAAPAAHRHQPVAGAVPARRPAEPGAPRAAGDRPAAGAARARDHRRRADRRLHRARCRSCAG